MAPKISKNTLKFELLIKEINLFENNIRNIDEYNPSTISILKAKLNTFENNLVSHFEQLSLHESEEVFEEYIKVKNVLLNWNIELENKIPSEKKNSNSVISPSNDSSIAVKLPKLEIPHFYGDNEAWISYKEFFKSSILDNKSLNDVEKLTYLNASIRGNAARLIRGFAITPENLSHCWDILCSRYENKRQLAICQINKIFRMKIVKANNSKILLEVIDICNEAIRNLQTLGLESNQLTELIIINFLTSKMDDSIIQRWELLLDNDTFPTLDKFKSFIEKEARSMQENKFSKPEVKKVISKQNLNHNIDRKSNINNTIVKKANVDQEPKHFNCILCTQSHGLFKCPLFNSMNVNDRLKLVKENNLCTNCLRGNHNTINCKVGLNCKNCGSRHHTLLHIYAVPDQGRQAESVSSVANSCTKTLENNVLLSTAIIKVKSQSGELFTCRALVDGASQNCLISRHCAERLKLTMHKSTHRLIGINETSAETSLFSTNFTFYPHFSAESFNVNALVVSKVTTSLPNFKMENRNWPHLNHLTLADPSYFIEGDIDVLLGADIFLSLITGTPILGPKGTPAALPTKLGHLLSGCINTQFIPNSSVVCHTLINIENALKNFWELESVPTTIKSEKKENSNDENEICEFIFQNSHTRNPEGRYILKLPFKEHFTLGDTKEGAVRRFYALERKLLTDNSLKEKYSAFMEEYEKLGHMTPLTSDLTSSHYFLPHHGVINNNSTTTKLRVVFDGSFKSTNGTSLNDNLITGKKLQTNIFQILTKFRTFPIAFSADIAKMYRQILIHPEHRKYQQILWRKSPQENLKTYSLNTVTYGTSCAPFLAIRTIHQLCEDEKDRFPLASKIAKNSFYVDDLLAGEHSVKSAQEVIQEMQNLMASGGFELRKWACSHPEVIANLPEDLKASNNFHSFNDDDSSQKILGLFWDLNEDAFQVRAIDSDNISTKRQLLSIIARIFDPLGFISPSTIILKIILQDLWKASLDWDDQIPHEIHIRWNKFQEEIEYFRKIKIPRYIHIKSDSNFQIHGFCDASPLAYSAVIYIRVLSDRPRVLLITSKTRVAPVKPVTLPRLELCGAVLLSELIDSLKSSLNIQNKDIYLWCDSTITLCWINNPPKKSNPFVQHRVGKIHSLTKKNSWHHIPGKANPADWATRGLYPKQLQENTEWITGPQWLYDFDPLTLSSNQYAHQTDELLSAVDSNSSPDSVCLIQHLNTSLDFINKFSSYLKLIRTISWIFRFTNNSKSTTKVTGPLKAFEINHSIHTIIKLVQETEYSSEILLLKNNKSLPKSSKLISLDPFLDSEGILRVGGRLRHQQDLTFDAKHPMLIPKNHHFTSLIIQHFHKTNFHAGQELVLSLIRQLFWIPDGKSTVRKELRKCIDCFKVYAKPTSQLMGDLPPSRIHPCRAFEQVGIDFAGPITTKCQHARKPALFKSYICLFICMCTKAVHLELVSSLTTTAFLASLRRFVSRRGYPSDIYSDNGTNFVGAAAYLKSLYNLPHDSTIQDYSSQRNIKWHFIPPHAPNFGGLWESSIKLTKFHLLKTCKAASFTFEELSTLLCQIEACINSRPLCPVSPDPKDLQVLTPGHFVIGCPLLEIPENVHTNSSLSSHSRFSLILKLKHDFWKRWKLSYLHHLQSRSKWRTSKGSLKPGLLVLVPDSSKQSKSWILGRIIQTFPGEDGHVRVVSLQTSKGLLKRATSQLAVLPDQESSPASSGRPEDVEDSIQ